MQLFCILKEGSFRRDEKKERKSDSELEWPSPHEILTHAWSDTFLVDDVPVNFYQ